MKHLHNGCLIYQMYLSCLIVCFSDKPQHSNSLYFTPMYDLRYDRWKRQCRRRKKAPTCNLAITATATPCRKRSLLRLRSDSEESPGSCDYEDEPENPSPQKTNASTPLHHPTPVSALGRPLEIVISRHSSQQSGKHLTNQYT